MGTLDNGGQRQRKEWLRLVVACGAILSVIVALSSERLSNQWRPRVKPPRGAPELLRPVALVKTSAPELEARLLGAASRALSDLRRCQRMLHASLGLLLPGNESSEDRRTIGWLDSNELPVAAYLPGRDTILVAWNNPIVILHEWLHALEDQRGVRFAKMDKATTTDERIALRTASEGFALVRSGGFLPQFFAARDLDGTALRFSYGVGGRYFASIPQNWEYDLAFVPSSSIEFLSGDMLHEVTGSMDGSGCVDRIGPAGILTLTWGRMALRDKGLRFASLWTGDSARMDFGMDHKATWTIWMREDPESRAFQELVDKEPARGIKVVLESPGH